MKINLAKVLPWLGVLVGAVIWIAAQSAGTSSSGGAYDDSSPTVASAPDTTAADAYLDKVATHLAQPGLWVDPSVHEASLDAQDIAALNARAKTAKGPVRIAVIPASALADGRAATQGTYEDCLDRALQQKDYTGIGDCSDLPRSGEPARLAYDPGEVDGLLYDRVGADGTYAVLVDAASQAEGRGFWADQWAEDGPTYDVGGAADHALDCCAPAYDAILGAFLDRAGNVHHSPWPIVGIIVGAILVLVGLGLGIRWWLRRRRQAAVDKEVAEALRPSLTEEVIELEQKVGSLPAYAGDPSGPVATATTRVLDLVEEARQRLDKPSRMDTPDEAEEVTERLGEARYQLAVIAALSAGMPAPGRTPPCFFDPRHGPSIDRRAFTPEGGAEMSVPVCADCRESLDHQQTPEIRTLPYSGGVRFYWDAGRYSRPYVNGYWRHDVFPDRRVERDRRTPSAAVSFARASRPAHEPAFRFVWEPSSSSGGSGWGSSGGRRSWSSSSRRSFGGGSSHRSSHRSGGGHGF